MALHGLGVRVQGAPAASVDRALAVLAHFGATPSPSGPVGLQVQFQVGPPPGGPRPPQTAEHLDLTVHRDRRGLWLHAPSTTTWIAPSGARAQVISHDGEPVPLHVFTCALVHQLRLAGRYTLHAAMVARGGRGCLVVGPSGAGKSTLTLALARAGWDLVSDDSVLLVPGPTGLQALALRRGIFLDPQTAAVPRTGARWRRCALVEAVKEELVLDGVGRVEGATPSLILLPEIADADRTTFEPADPLDACWALAVESRLGELDRTGIAEHLQVIGDLAGTTRALRARLGRDVLQSTSDLAQRLATALEDAPPVPVSRSSADGGSPLSVAGQAPYAPIPGHGGVLLHPDTLEVFALDPVGARIWELASQLPADRIAEVLTDEATAPFQPADVQALLDDLAAAGFSPPTPRSA